MRRLLKSILIIIAIAVGVISCKSIEEETFVQKTEKAHEIEAFKKQEAIQFDIKITFGGKERLDGKVTLLTNSSKGLIAFKNGTKIIYNQDKVYYSPEITDTKGIRFDAYTWAYFFMFPYKMSDQGTIWKNYENKEKDALNYNSQRLTFESGTGDAPDDWYVVYTNKKNNLVNKAAYIVTAHNSKEEAEKNPHAIKYSDYQVFDSIPIATQWSFWEWIAGTGLTKEIGNAQLSGIKFIKVEAGTFTPGSDFKTI